MLLNGGTARLISIDHMEKPRQKGCACHTFSTQGRSGWQLLFLRPGYLFGAGPELSATAEQNEGQGPLLEYRQQSFMTNRSINICFHYITAESKVGLLVIDVPGTSFQQLIEKYNTYYKGQVILANASDRIVYHTDPQRIQESCFLGLGVV